MHPTEIKAFARKTALDEAFAGKNVKGYVTAIKDGQKLWLGRTGFTPDKSQARKVDYDAEKVGDQIMQVAMQIGELLDFEQA